MKKSFALLLAACALLLFGCAPAKEKQEPVAPFDFDVLQRDETAEILVVGNSFIWTSRVCSFLERVCQENNASVNVVEHAVGMSQAKQHYAEIFEQQLLPEVLEDRYDVIVLQTIYDSMDRYAVKDFLDAMDAHSLHAQLLLFPAENESSYAEVAKTHYRKARIANWRMLIFELKWEQNFPTESLNFIDTYMHSNELAGYAGAVLLYQRMYNLVPDVTLLDEQMLGEYSQLIPGETEQEKRESLKTIVTYAGRQIALDDQIYFDEYALQDKPEDPVNL